MILAIPVALLVPGLVALGLIFLLWPERRPLSSNLLLMICLASGVGLGISSCIFFLQLLLFGPSRIGFISIQLLLLALLGVVLIYSLKSRRAIVESQSPIEPRQRTMLRIILSVIFLAALVSAAVTFIFISLKKPHGDWDAWAVYNMKARFLFRGGENWKDLYSEPLYWTSTDYPLLIPAAIAGIWTFIGKETVAVPALVGMAYTFASVGLAVFGLSIIRSRCQGLMAGLILLCTPFFVGHGTAQYSDIPIGFFFLATLVLLSLQRRSPEGNHGFLVLAGLTAGLAAWTKNEGLLFSLAIVVARFVVVVPRQGLKPYLRQMMFFAAGLIPLLTIVLYLKMALGQPNMFLSPGGGPGFVAKVTDPYRYRIIAEAFWQQISSFGGWAVSIEALLLAYLLLMGAAIEEADKESILVTFVLLGIMLLGYFAIFVLSPRDLAWHLGTSLDRLFSQLWPSFIFGFFLIVRTPEEAMARRHVAMEPA